MTPQDLERDRVARLRSLRILDTAAEIHFDSVCRTAADLFDVPIALVPLVDEHRLWFKARHGLAEESCGREATFCDATIRRDRGDPLVIHDLRTDARFAASPLVREAPHARFYAGVPLGLASGHTIGTLCVIDRKPRPDFQARQVRQLQDLARVIEAHLSLHEARIESEAELRERRRVEALLLEREERLRLAQAARAMAERTACFGHWWIDVDTRTIRWSDGVSRIFGRDPPGEDEAGGDLPLETHLQSYHPQDRAHVRQVIADACAGGPSADGAGYDHRSRVLRPDGEERVVEVHGIAERDAGGRVVKLHGVCLDVTGLAQAEQRQRETSELLRTTLEAMDQGLVMVGSDGLVRVHNQRARDLLDLPETVLHEGADFARLHRHQVETGEFGSAPDVLRRRLESCDAEKVAYAYERARPNGTILEVRSVLLQSGGLVRTFTDITERRRREAALRASEAEYQSLFQNAVVGVYRADLDGRITRANRAFIRMHGASDEAGIHGLDGLNHDWYVESGRHEAFLAVLERDGRVDDFVSEIRTHAGGERIWVSETAWLVRGPGGEPVWLEGTLTDATARKRAEALVEHMARHDALTGLPNRRLFHETLAREIDAARQSGTQVGVLCCDLDRFKAVNDTFGHPAGDALLRTLAERLTSTLRCGDMVARLGGDEFAIILQGRAAPDEMSAVAERVIDAVGRPLELDGNLAHVGVSIGIAVCPGDGAIPDTLFKSADIALYRAKEAGRNTYRFYEPGLDVALARRNRLEIDLREAVRGGGFTLEYQPILDIESGRTSGFEALMRWQHRTRGMVPPSDFIPLAEETGLIGPLGAWALAEACREAANWPSHLRVAVNVSSVQFQQGEVERTVLKALATSGLDPRRLELEITESVLMKDSETVLDSLLRLRRLGVRLALDDFGTGYSSLSYLCRFPFDKIKIDHSFVRNIDASASSAIVRAVVGLGQFLGARVTAEGVETEEQFERVRLKGCTEIQGFFYSRPVPAEEARTFAALEDARRAA